jgi:ABC-type transporter Mla MlaB component
MKGGSKVLRIHVENEPDSVRLRLEGKLIHPWVDELFKAWMDVSPRIPGHWSVLVDLSEVSFVDARGKAMLAAMRRAGCSLRGPTPFIEAVIAEVESLSKD